MISKIDSPAFYLILWMLLLAIVPQSHAQQPSVPPQEGDTLDNITISEAEARNIMKGLFDLPRLTHSLALGRIAKDERLTAFTDGFMQRNNIQVLTIGYIDSDEFWPRIFRQQRLNKINKADNDNLLAAKIIFTPIATDGPPTGYTTTLELAGKTSTVYELLSISQAEVDSIAASTSQQQLGNTTFATPNEAKETVVSALIAALQRVELKASPQDALALVTFQAAPADEGLPTYGFDQMVYEQLAADYPTATIAGQTVRTAWKSLKSDASDKVTAVAAGDVTPVFQMDGVALTATPGNINTYKVALMGASDGTASEVLALTSADNGLTMGLLNTISYDEEHTSVKIVPVNGAGSSITQAALQEALNDIYASAIATWDVEVLPGVQLGMAWDEDGDGKLSDGETGMLSNYTGEMNALIAEFRKNHDRQKDAYYIFLVDKPKTPNKLGYMPRKKQWGFVFAGNHNNNVALTKTIAHELGHGVFHLEHTFSEKGLPQGQTNNLMDYTANGTALYKYQWDYVHDPVNVVTLFDDDEEGAMSALYYDGGKLIKFLTKIRENNKKKTPVDLKLTSGVVSNKDLNDQAIISKYLGEFESENNSFLNGILRAYPSDESIRSVLSDHIADTLYNPLESPYNQEPILLALRVPVVLDDNILVTPGQNFTITMHGYSVTNSLITHYAERKRNLSETTYIFYNGKSPKKGNNPGESDELSNRKALSFTVPKSEEDRFEKYLSIKGLIEFRQTLQDSHDEEIRVLITRERHNEYITLGAIRIEGTNIEGVTLELGKGTSEESNSTCTDEMITRYACKRIPAGTYEFELNTSVESSQGQHVFRSIRLVDTNSSNRQGILIHRGTSYSFTRGCILAMYTDQLNEILNKPNEFLNGDIMGYNTNFGNVSASEIFNMALYEYIQRVDEEGVLRKKVVIVDSESEGSLSIPLSEFQMRQKAGNYYIDLNVATKADQMVTELPSTLINAQLTQEGIFTAMNNAIRSINLRIQNGESINNDLFRRELLAEWETLYAPILPSMTSTNVINSFDVDEDFITPLKSWLTQQLANEPQRETVINRLFSSAISPPGAPIFHNYTNSDGEPIRESLSDLLSDISSIVVQLRDSYINEHLN
ncbi:MAG: DUF5675 family protein [Imperialibacter sp.]|uniref:DUF5675 family protein n=1 Tax=Imperialibacter sp. TaxID=2038411 RepID=UPI0032F04D94